MKKIQNIKNVLFFSMLLIPFAIQSCGDEAEFYGFNPITVSEDHRAPASTVTDQKRTMGLYGLLRATTRKRVNEKKRSKTHHIKIIRTNLVQARIQIQRENKVYEIDIIRIFCD